MSVGVAGLIVNDGLIRFVFDGLRDEAVFGRYGHIQIYKQGYIAHHRAAPYDFLIPDSAYQLLRLRLLRHAEISAVAGELTVPVMLQSGSTTAAGIALGVDPVATLTGSQRKLISGSMNLTMIDPIHPVLLGRGMAERLQATPGQIITVMTTSHDGSYNALDLQVRGIFEEGFRDFDDWSIELPLKTLQSLIGQNSVERVLVFVKRMESVDKIRALVNSQSLGAELKFDSTTWFDLADFYKEVVAMFGKELKAVKFIISTITFLAFASFLAMSFTERKQESAVLLSLGMSKLQLARMFLYESVLLGFMGATFGAVAGVVTAKIVSLIGIPMPAPPGSTAPFTARVEINISPIVEYCLTTVIVAFLAGVVLSLWIWCLDVPAALREVEG
jgi:putative ABC transport system permease protein